MIKNKNWIPFLVILLLAEMAYVVMEFAFNASILNVSSQAIAASDQAPYLLETFGQKLSGVGLGLLVFGVIMVRRKTPPSIVRQAIAIAIIFPASIFTMTEFQSWLIYDYIPSNATQQEHFASRYTQYLAPAIRNGMVDIEGVPITPETLSRPESKAFLTLLAPALMHNSKVIDKIVRSSEDIIKFQVHRAATERSSELYQTYQSAMNKVDIAAAYKEYESASLLYEYTVDKEKAGVKYSQAYKNFNFALGSHWVRYTTGRSQSHRLPPPGLSPTNFAAHQKTLSILQISNRELREQIRPHHFRILHGPRRGDMRFDSSEAFYLTIDIEGQKKFRNKWAQGSLDRFGSRGSYITPGMSRYEFFRSKWAQSIVRQYADLPGTQPVVPGLSESQFFNEFLIPATWEQVEQAIGSLPGSIDEATPSKNALTSIYGPAIALGVSLLFSLLTLGKIIGRVWMIAACSTSIPARTVQKIKLGINVASALVILGLPFVITTNSLAQSEVIEAAGSESVSPITVKAMRWTLDMEPIIFPIGNAILPYIEIGGLNLYHDPHAGDSDNKDAAVKIDQVELSTPLSVKELQRRLAEEGLNPGPIDGVIGQSTIKALKLFQSRHDLNVTGTQNLETIQTLRRHR